jgi:2-polyprenyl-3-methyl-5-hydroxy-6-metoxy-1,4-benzoquinol methylase
MTPGTEGYEKFVPLFIQSSQNLDFNLVCKDFVDFLPSKNSNILDLGAGAGQNSAALDKLGFNVTAIEPMIEFLNAAMFKYRETSIKWLHGSLPDITCLDADKETFDFVLIDAVWHHLCQDERDIATARISSLINKNGRCAISLRNGPSGMGTRVFPTNSDNTINLFESYGFKCIFSLSNQPSILPHKDKVKWHRIVLEKIV